MLLLGPPFSEVLEVWIEISLFTRFFLLTFFFPPPGESVFHEYEYLWRLFDEPGERV